MTALAISIPVRRPNALPDPKELGSQRSSLAKIELDAERSRSRLVQPKFAVLVLFS